MAVRNYRNRYVGFVIQGGKTTRRKMISAIRSSFDKDEYHRISPWLTVFDGEKGIVRCQHHGNDRVVEVLNKIEVEGGKVKTVVTSGTIKKVKDRLFRDE